MSERRYTVYTMRRTSSRAVYAIYDNHYNRPVLEFSDRYPDGKPWTTTDRAEAARCARSMNHPPRVA